MKVLSRSFMVVLFLLLAIGGIIVLESTLELEKNNAQFTDHKGNTSPSLASQKGLFENTIQASAFSELGFDSTQGRNMDDYYENRAYHGAPPVIPHPITTTHTIGAKNCLKCHQNGGYVDKFDGFAPITPHPQLVSCVQCHVPVNDNRLFRESEFAGLNKPDINQRAMMGSPPVIPHKIHMRETCLSCHSGPSAPQAIKTTHPERINCLQCHAKGEKAQDFGEWIRKTQPLKEDGNDNE